MSVISPVSVTTSPATCALQRHPAIPGVVGRRPVPSTRVHRSGRSSRARTGLNSSSPLSASDLLSFSLLERGAVGPPDRTSLDRRNVAVGSPGETSSNHRSGLVAAGLGAACSALLSSRTTIKKSYLLVRPGLARTAVYLDSDSTFSLESSLQPITISGRNTIRIIGGKIPLAPLRIWG